MSVDVRTNISEKFDKTEVIINAPERNEEIDRIEQALKSLDENEISEIIGLNGNNIFIIKVKDVIVFYSEEKNNYCRTKEGTFRIKEKMYYLEDMLPHKDFVRISNSAIININNVKCFDTSIIGRITVRFKDGTSEEVSRRRTSELMKFLKGR